MLPTITTLLAVAPALIIARIITIAAALGLWYWTQALLARRVPTPSTDATATTSADGPYICDGIHNLTARIHCRLIENPRRADRLLVVSSAVIDLLGIWVVGSSVFGATFQPFLGLLMLFALRQICQAFCPLPLPQGMIWRDPGVPTMLVTYGTSNDLFFSGHTAIAVYGALCLATALGPVGIALGLLIAAFEIAAVLVLRAHYTMDVFTGAITALYVHHVASTVAPSVDHWLRLAAHLQ